MKCATCGKEEFLPFTCPYCNKPFCQAHRLPENHACPKLPQENLVDYVYGQEKAKAEVQKAVERVEDRFWHKLRRKLKL